MGKHLELSIQEAYNNMLTALVYIINKTEKYKVKILLETPAGQGTEICTDIKEFGYFYKKTQRIDKIKDRIGVCIDTCHLFSAGYDLRKKNDVNDVVRQIHKHIGFENVNLIHFNDSAVPVGARNDRHANIGKGHIGKDGLIYFLSKIKKYNIPIVLETPDKGYRKEIKIIKKSLKSI